jgi:hypothetical protein
LARIFFTVWKLLMEKQPSMLSSLVNLSNILLKNSSGGNGVLAFIGCFELSLLKYPHFGPPL